MPVSMLEETVPDKTILVELNTTRPNCPLAAGMEAVHWKIRGCKIDESINCGLSSGFYSQLQCITQLNYAHRRFNCPAC